MCGGRAYGVQYTHDGHERPGWHLERNHLVSTLDNIHELHGITHLAEGGAPGADYFAAQWARQHPGILLYTYPADWDQYGKGAGPRRNQLMLDEFHPDWVVAFPGGTGTADMKRRALKAGVALHNTAYQGSIPGLGELS